MSNKYSLLHTFEYGQEYYHLTSKKSLDSIINVVNDYSDTEVGPKLQKLMDKLSITFEPWKGDQLYLDVYENPVWVDLDK